jgi:hypothetical protein
MYRICYHVPVSHVDATKAALFAAGAGRVGDYEACCWQVRGEGQFRPLPGSRPFVGREGRLERVEEYRVELVCADEHLAGAIAALKGSHPYEEPAYAVWRLEDV